MYFIGKIVEDLNKVETRGLNGRSIVHLYRFLLNYHQYGQTCQIITISIYNSLSRALIRGDTDSHFDLQLKKQHKFKYYIILRVKNAIKSYICKLLIKH